MYNLLRFFKKEKKQKKVLVNSNLFSNLLNDFLSILIEEYKQKELENNSLKKTIEANQIAFDDFQKILKQKDEKIKELENKISNLLENNAIDRGL